MINTSKSDINKIYKENKTSLLKMKTQVSLSASKGVGRSKGIMSRSSTSS